MRIFKNINNIIFNSIYSVYKTVDASPRLKTSAKIIDIALLGFIAGGSIYCAFETIKRVRSRTSLAVISCGVIFYSTWDIVSTLAEKFFNTIGWQENDHSFFKFGIRRIIVEYSSPLIAFIFAAKIALPLGIAKTAIDGIGFTLQAVVISTSTVSSLVFSAKTIAKIKSLFAQSTQDAKNNKI